MARGLTRLVGANALSGTLPSSVIANSTFDNITVLPTAVPTGKPVLLSTATASSSASIEFTSGIDSTYDIYKWEFININPATNNTDFEFNISSNGGSNYNVTKTSTSFETFHNESDSETSLNYIGVNDLAQSTGDQKLNRNTGNGSDESLSGELYLFNPSNTTFVKHYISTTNSYNGENYTQQGFIGGYGNTTSAVNAIIFRMSSGNFDGTIKMYGISA